MFNVLDRMDGYKIRYHNSLHLTRSTNCIKLVTSPFLVLTANTNLGQKKEQLQSSIALLPPPEWSWSWYPIVTWVAQLLANSRYDINCRVISWNVRYLLRGPHDSELFAFSDCNSWFSDSLISHAATYIYPRSAKVFYTFRATLAPS